MYRAKVTVTLKPDVMDPQGQAIQEAAHHLGLSAIKNLRVGRYFEFDVDATDENVAATCVELICDKLLANPIIETYEFTLRDVTAEAKQQ